MDTLNSNNINDFTFNKVIEEISENLEDIAKFIVAKEISVEKDYLIKLYKQQFFIEIDCNKQHKYNWHQWGILTHSRNCVQMYDTEVKEYLKKWKYLNIVEESLVKEIDGIPKSKLIYLGILLHDLGKFKKKCIIEANQKIKWSFIKHEVFSEEIILNDLYSLLHKHYKLSGKQIKYISICARHHGLIRQIIKKSNLNYSMQFIQSEEFKTLLLNELSSLMQYQVEIGLLFFADLCAKTDVPFLNRNDNEILNDLEIKQLNPKLLNAIRQKEQSIELVKHYFKIILEKK